MTSAKRKTALALAVAGVMAISVVPASAVTRAKKARTGAGFIVRQQEGNGSIVAFSEYGSTSDAIVALVAAERGPKAIKAALGFLARRVRNGKVFDDPDTGVLGKIVIAVEAAGKNSRRFGGKNLVKRIVRLRRPSGRLGRGTEVNSHALMIIGLAAAGKHVPRRVVAWLREARCGDGGWAFDNPPRTNDDEHCKDSSDPNDFFTSDSNTTANALMALEATGRNAPARAFDFLDTLRDDQDGGWGFTQGFTATDANSTGLVVQAYVAANRDLPAGAMAGLKGLQFPLCGRRGGAFDFTYGDDDGDGNPNNDPPNLGATIAAVPALMKKPLPLRPFKVTRPVPSKKPCN